MRSRAKTGRALFLTRDSGGRHENTPRQYIEWAARTARDLGLTFRGTAEQIERMIRTGDSVEGDVFLDFGVSGEKLSRKGLDAFMDTALGDETVTHVFIPRRDRLCRPEDPADGMKLERRLRESGITIVFMDRTCPPIRRGRKLDVGDMISTYLDYNYAGEYVIDLAHKMILSQINLANQGFSIGGRAPYGFRRTLVREDGTSVRQLADGEYVKMAHHHVVWLPGPENELTIIKRILNMLKTLPASRVAAILTAEGIPPPDAERMRTDHGIRHRTRGIWHQTTVTNIARSRLNQAVTSYGRRSMGRLLRYTPEGPRPLDEHEYLEGDKKKVVRNDESKMITAHAHFERLIEPDQHRELMEILDARAGTQRGKPRSRTPGQNPLGSRVFDMACCWPMYRTPTGNGFSYKCGLYQQSHGQQCSHNWVDGEAATRFVMNSVRQRVFATGSLRRIEKRLQELAEKEASDTSDTTAVKAAESQLADVKVKIDRAATNMAMAENEKQLRAIQAVFEHLQADKQRLEAQLMELRVKPLTYQDPSHEVAKALRVLDDLGTILSDPSCMSKAGDLIQQFNARLFLRFQPVKKTKRIENKLAAGILTLGSAPLPIRPYQGPTSRKILLAAPVPAGEKIQAAPNVGTATSSGKVESLGNVGRGDRI